LIIDVIIPVFNEESSIGFVIRDIPHRLVRNIYVCDNGSTDQSAEIASEAGAIVLLESKKGYGAACLHAVRYIDYSDRASEMDLLIQKLKEDQLDLVIGSRVLGNAAQGSLGVVQKFGNRLATWLIRLLFNYRYTDLGPFRAIRFTKLLELDMKDKDYGWTVEMQVKAAQKKFRVGEVAVSYHKRIGKSKISGTLKGILGAGSKILYTIFKSFVKG
jgi:glycosyltransferase involved in cell wall biosynthesis